MDIHHLRTWAHELGFGDVALCDASVFSEARARVESQPPLAERRHLRYEPISDAPQTRSLAVLLWPYVQIKQDEGRQLFVDSYYEASNAAYHAARLLEQKLTEAGHFAKANVSYPAREAALRAGLGVIGHNGLLIHQKFGTRVVIILMATDIDPQSPCKIKNEGCVACGRCISACPSGAIDKNGMSHPERCLRNYMMEGVVVPEKVRPAIGNRLLGCDICQRVCPMQPDEQQGGKTWLLDDFVVADDKQFSAQIAKLAEHIGRNTARPQRVRAQAALLCGNVGSKSDLPVLRLWAQSDFEAVRKHAQWAIKRIESCTSRQE